MSGGERAKGALIGWPAEPLGVPLARLYGTRIRKKSAEKASRRITMVMHTSSLGLPPRLTPCPIYATYHDAHGGKAEETAKCAIYIYI